MREILFRGKGTHFGKWVYGYYYHESGKDYILPYSTKEAVEHVSQYTGLDDRHGTKIFEGDIVRYRGDIFEIAWDQYFCRFYRKAASVAEHGMRQLFPLCEIEELELIGNIYENKDLLG